MKKIVLTAIMVFFAVNIYASDFKMGYVDMQQIIITSEQGKEAQKTLSSIESAQNTLINEKIKEIKKLEDVLAKQDSILTPESKEKKKAELNKQILDYQTKGRNFKKELQQKEAELIQEIILDVDNILAKIAQEKGYTAILNKAGIAYMPADLDLTDTVINILNSASSEK